MVDITYRGLKKLDDMESSKLKTLCERYYPKLQRHFDEPKLVVDVRKFDNEGNRARFNIKLRFDVKSKKVFSAEHEDWEMAKAIHKVFDNIQAMAKHEFKNDSTTRRPKNFKI